MRARLSCALRMKSSEQWVKLMSDAEILRQDLWSFAVSLYGKLGVKDACLLLQEDADMDVCLVLALCWWATTCRAPLGDDQIRALQNVSDAYQANILKPLRGVRTYLKSNTPNRFEADWAALRKEEILAAELTFERNLLDTYAQLIGTDLVDTNAGHTSPDGLFGAALDRISGDKADLKTGAAQAALAVIRKAVF